MFTFLWLSCIAEKTQTFSFDEQEENHINEDTSPEDSEPANDVSDPEVHTEEPEANTEEPEDQVDLSSEICVGRDTGTELGQCAVNFALPDRSGEMITLHTFYGDVIFLDLSAFT